VSLFAGVALTCHRGGRRVFSGLEFAVENGGALVLTGPNGSGKSSLLRIMAGLLRPFAGGLRWNGQTVADDPGAHRRRIAYLGHLDAVKPVLTVLETVRFSLKRSVTREDALAALAVFGLAERADMQVRFLSAGQRRRVALARILVAEAPLWLLDEPTVGLDRQSVEALEGALARHRAAGGVVAVSTHAPLALADAVGLDLDRFRTAPTS
jgi:heme exporter protein A